MAAVVREAAWGAAASGGESEEVAVEAVVGVAAMAGQEGGGAAVGAGTMARVEEMA